MAQIFADAQPHSRLFNVCALYGCDPAHDPAILFETLGVLHGIKGGAGDRKYGGKYDKVNLTFS
jgi:hypothetical protein